MSFQIPETDPTWSLHGFSIKIYFHSHLIKSPFVLIELPSKAANIPTNLQ